MPVAACAAKWSPESRARKSAIGPDVNGIPTSHPPTSAPHRRPARLAAPTSSGVATSLRKKTSKSGAQRTGLDAGVFERAPDRRRDCRCAGRVAVHANRVEAAGAGELEGLRGGLVRV